MKGLKIWAFFLALCLSGCSTLVKERIITETVTEYRDSTAWRDTTIYVPIPLESDQAIVQVGDTSHRETSVAESDAWVGSDGLLHHNLRNKPTRIPYQAILPERWLMTTVQNMKEEAHTIVREVKVEKPLTWSQKAKINAFPWLTLAVILLLIWVTRKWWL